MVKIMVPNPIKMHDLGGPPLFLETPISSKDVSFRGDFPQKGALLIRVLILPVRRRHFTGDNDYEYIPPESLT